MRGMIIALFSTFPVASWAKISALACNHRTNSKSPHHTKPNQIYDLLFQVHRYDIVRHTTYDMARLKRSPKQPALRPSANNLSSTTDSRGEPSPGLTANLPSNNPFRNRAASPANALPSPVATTFNNTPSTAPERPLSRNPFLDQSDKKDATTVQVRQTSPLRGTSTMAGRSSLRKLELTGHAVDLFVSRPLLVWIKSDSVDADSSPPRTT